MVERYLIENCTSLHQMAEETKKDHVEDGQPNSEYRLNSEQSSNINHEDSENFNYLYLNTISHLHFHSFGAK
jgi:hypothetical protein